MKVTSLVIVLVVVIVAAWGIAKVFPREHMSGYGTMSGLYFNNKNNMSCFTNIYDDPPVLYCGVSSKVVQ